MGSTPILATFLYSRTIKHPLIYTVYILYASAYNKVYIGYTSNLLQRIKSHNIVGKKDWAIRYRPWVVIYLEYFDSKQLAIQREKYYKAGQGRKWIRNKLIEQYTTLGYIC